MFEGGNNMQIGLGKKGLVLGIILLFVGTGAMPSMSRNIGKIKDILNIDNYENQEKQFAYMGDPPETEWIKTFGGTNEEEGSCVQQTTDGGYIITGTTNSFGEYDNGYLIKTDSNGNKIWDQTYGGNKADVGYSVQQTNDGGYIITGWTRSYGSGDFDVWLIKTDSNGNKLWDKTFGGINFDEGRAVKQTKDGGYIIVGVTSSFGMGNEDILLIKTNANGESISNSIIKNNSKVNGIKIFESMKKYIEDKII